jgi:hypothetical protein
MVPVSLAAGLILGSAHRFVRDDIAAVQLESLARVADAQPPPMKIVETTDEPEEIEDRS